MKKILLFAAVLLAAGIVVLAAWRVFLAENDAGPVEAVNVPEQASSARTAFPSEDASAAADAATTSSAAVADTAATAATAATAQAAAPAEEIPIDFASIWETSPDVYAWIRVPGTNIDYPVCQGGEELDVDYYLSHRPDGTAEFAGSIYSQYYNAKDFSDPDTILYGHDMADGSMFRTLHSFEDQTFFDTHREVTVYLPDRVLHYFIFAAYHTNDDHILGAHDFFQDPAVFSRYLQDIFTGESVYYGFVDENVQLTVESRILTLSTCNNREDQRYVVQCVLINPG